MANTFFDEDDFSSESETDVQEFEAYMNGDSSKKSPTDVKPATEQDRVEAAEKGKATTDTEKAEETRRLIAEQKRKEEEEARKFIEGEDSEDASQSKTTKPKTDSTASTAPEVEGISQLAEDLFKANIWTRDEDEEGVPETTEEFIERFNYEKQKGAEQMVHELLGRHGESYREALEAILVNGVDPKTYLSKFEQVNSFKDMDMTEESNQERVIETALKNQGWDPADIRDEVKRLRLNSDLESTAQRHHKAPVKTEEAGLLKMQADEKIKVEQKKQAALQESQNIRTTLAEAVKKQDLDGVPVTREDAPKIVDFLERKNWKDTTTGELLTDYEFAILELNRPQNHKEKVKLAALLKKSIGDVQVGKPIVLNLTGVKKKAVSEESNELFGFIKNKARKSNSQIAEPTEKSNSAFWNEL